MPRYTWYPTVSVEALAVHDSEASPVFESVTVALVPLLPKSI